MCIRDRYMYCTVHSVVDEVCIYTARQEIEKKKGKRNVPLRIAEDGCKYDLGLTNEWNNLAGKYGWCIVCRKTASLLCKSSRVPLCSAECGGRHEKMMQMLEVYLEHREERAKYVHDVVMLFRSVCKLSQRDLTADVNAISL
eukprot:TRINITY_DN8317_c0_g1_i3.p3 TRINITY_DN8317_c0_g1~~TRINITY_DN8317_c0_g1_i3.p3  ORF type:complete len:142 (+),score=47.93 TRINITY_DN8317_c0_g1_i3:80-505(+)